MTRGTKKGREGERKRVRERKKGRKGRRETDYVVQADSNSLCNPHGWL